MTTTVVITITVLLLWVICMVIYITNQNDGLANAKRMIRELDRALDIERSDHSITKQNLALLGKRYDTRAQTTEDVQTELTNARWAAQQAFNVLEEYLESDIS